ncbi:MAG: E3 binding domain-containing protein, partial [Candidatus Bathyarchaeota archaeon]|nr:E3 binding domain-containing protein [Candidatus Bathyarchaeota archaeon]
MPRLSLAMKKGTVIEWFKKEGDTVEKGEPIVEVLTEKVTYDIEAPSSGVLRKILVEVGAEVPVAGILGVITAPDEELPVLEVAAEPSLERVEERIIASPAAKRLAREYGVDLVQVKGTGPDGRIVEEDIRRYVEAKEVAPKIREVIPLTGIRKTAAERVSLSARTAPHTTLNMEVVMSKAAKLREDVTVSYTDMVTKATAMALVEHPIINSTLDGAQ